VTSTKVLNGVDSEVKLKVCTDMKLRFTCYDSNCSSLRVFVYSCFPHMLFLTF